MSDNQNHILDYPFPLERGKFSPKKRDIGSEVRKKFFREANYTCEVCAATALPTLFVDSLGRIKVFNKKTGHLDSHNHLTLDHIVPKSFGSSNYEYNLIVLCETCNNKKENKMPRDWLKELPVEVQEKLIDRVIRAEIYHVLVAEP